MKKLKTIVVLPAYNAEATLEKTIADIPLEFVDELILVDDASKDNTVELAKLIANKHPKFVLFDDNIPQKDNANILFTVIRHDKNKGYGGNQKKCYQTALAHGADIVVMLHPDYQYDPKLVKYFVEFIRDGYFDVMLGSRIRSRKEAIEGGMPRYKYYANRVLSFIENIASGRSLSEWHTGMRAYTRDVLEKIDYQNFSDDFIFDTQALFAIIEKGYSVGDIPVPVRYFKEASSINFKRSARYGLLTLWETGKYVFKSSKQIIKYLIAGFLGVATNLILYSLFIYQFHFWYISAAIVAFMCGAVTSFTLQKFWTFNQKSTKKIYTEVVKYLLLITFNVFANSVILFILVQQFLLGKFIANMISISIVSIWSFFIYKNFTFKD